MAPSAGRPLTGGGGPEDGSRSDGGTSGSRRRATVSVIETSHCVTVGSLKPEQDGFTEPGPSQLASFPTGGLHLTSRTHVNTASFGPVR